MSAHYWLICYLEERRSKTSITSYYVNEVYCGTLAKWQAEANAAHKQVNADHDLQSTHVIVSATPISRDDYAELNAMADDGEFGDTVTVRSMGI